MRSHSFFTLFKLQIEMVGKGMELFFFTSFKLQIEMVGKGMRSRFSLPCLSYK